MIREPITEIAPDWEPMDSLLFAPPRAAREDDGSFLIEAHFKTTDGRDPIEGERICRLPSGVRESLDGTPRLATVTIRCGGRVRVEEHQIDEEGWVLVPRVLLDRRVIGKPTRRRLETASEVGSMSSKGRAQIAPLAIYFVVVLAVALLGADVPFIIGGSLVVAVVLMSAAIALLVGALGLVLFGLLREGRPHVDARTSTHPPFRTSLLHWLRMGHWPLWTGTPDWCAKCPRVFV